MSSCLHAIGLAHQHQTMSHHNHLIQLDDFANEGRQGLQPLLCTVVLHENMLKQSKMQALDPKVLHNDARQLQGSLAQSDGVLYNKV